MTVSREGNWRDFSTNVSKAENAHLRADRNEQFQCFRVDITNLDTSLAKRSASCDEADPRTH